MMEDANESPRKVLVINDEPGIIEAIDFLLGQEGFEVSGAPDGMHGLEALNKVRPDLIFIDTHMPGMHGREVYKHIKADDNLKDIPVIAVGVWSDEGTQEQVERDFPNVDGYVNLPNDILHVLRVVNEVL